MEGQSTYVTILMDSLENKSKILLQLYQLTQGQTDLLDSETFSFDQFEVSLEQKERLLEKLSELDLGFTEVYHRVSKVLSESKLLYQKEIQRMQNFIQQSTDIGVAITALEEKNKQKFNIRLSGKRQEIKSFKVSSQTAATYYKNMTNQHQSGHSYFLNKKY